MGNSESNGDSSSSDRGDRYHGEHYNSSGSGLYNIGYDQGWEDSATRSTSENALDYIPANTSDGNAGYRDGAADGGNFGER
jgi:hypothetical protein